MTDRQMAIIERALELHGMGDELIEAWQALKSAVEIDISIQQPQHKISTRPCKWGYAKCVFDVCFERCDTCKVTKTA